MFKPFSVAICITTILTGSAPAIAQNTTPVYDNVHKEQKFRKKSSAPVQNQQVPAGHNQRLGKLSHGDNNSMGNMRKSYTAPAKPAAAQSANK